MIEAQRERDETSEVKRNRERIGKIANFLGIASQCGNARLQKIANLSTIAVQRPVTA
jgi:bacterioferritin-associated ferredoxin